MNLSAILCKKTEAWFYDGQNPRSGHILLAVSLLAAVLFSFLYGAVSRPLLRDVIAYYTPMAQAFIDSDWGNAFYLNVPVLQSVLAGILGKCLGVSGHSAVISMSCLFYILTVFPVYSIGRYFLSERLAGLGSLLFALAPVVVKNSCNGTLDSGRVFFTAWCIAILLKIYSRTEFRDYCLLGVSAAGLAMIRGEGVIFSVLFYGWALLFSEFGPAAVKARRKRSCLYLLSLAVFCFLIFPRALQCYRQTGYPALDFRQVDSIRFYWSRICSAVCPEGASEAPGEPAVEKKAVVTVASLREDAGDFSKNWSTSSISREFFKAAEPYQYIFTVRELFRDFCRGTYELYVILGLFGVNILVRRKEKLPELLMLLSAVAVNAVCFSLICLAHRYFIVNIVFLLPFVLQGIDNIRCFIMERCPVHGRRIIAGLSVLLFVFMMADIASKFIRNMKSPYRGSAVLIRKQFPDLNRKNALCLARDVRLAFCLDIVNYPLLSLEKSIAGKPGVKYVIAALKNQKDEEMSEVLQKEGFCYMPELSRPKCSIFLKIIQ